MISYNKPVTNTPIQLLGCLLVALILVGESQAFEFQFSRYLEVGATATDNPQLQQIEDEPELVLNIRPSVELKFSGNRLASLVVAEMEYFRFQEADDGISDPRLFARTKGTLIDNLLFLDTTITYAKLSPDSSFLRLGQVEDPAARLKGRLFFDRSFGEAADVYVAFNHSSFFSQIGDGADSRQYGMDFWVGRDPNYGGLLWSVGGYYDRDSSVSNLLDNASLYGSLGITLSEVLLGQVTVGVEDRKYTNALDTGNPITTEDERSSLWDANVTWSPSERTSLTVGYGERFFGKGPNLRLRHRTENSIFTASYAQDITRTAPSLSSISSLSNALGSETFTDTNSITVDNQNIVAELDEPFVDNRFQLSYKLQGRRSEFLADAVYSIQDQLAGDEEIKSWLGRLVFDRSLSARTRLRLQYEHQNSEAPERVTKNFTENRVGLKFIFNFDQVESSRDIEFSE